MKFLIMGSSKSIPVADKDAFLAACQQLGMRLAEGRHTIIINSTDTETADLHVLEGVDKVAGRNPVILLQSSEETDGQAQDLSRFQNIDLQTQTIGGRWPGNRIQAISKADAVILIGGRFGVAAVGASAPMLKTPVVAIGSFGGSAREVLDEVSFYYGHASVSADDVRTLRGNWRSNYSADIIVKVAEALVKQNPFRQDQVSQFLVVLSIFGLLAA